MTKYTFHPEYVAPYYELLMNANFVNHPDRIPGLFNGLKKVGQELDAFELALMLRSSWRPSKVAAWIIGLNQKVELEDELISTLHSTLIYCEHLIFGLALLNTENSIVSIESHIQLETDALKKNFQLLRIDQVSFDWAIAALTWLDKINKTKRVEKTLRIWDAFKRHVEIYENKYRFKLDRFIHIDEKIRIFDEAMVFANSY